jgi:DNA polymerase III subunit chi
MPRAEFYLIDKPRFRGEPTLVLARSAEQAEALDDLLWSFDPDAFVPHQIAGNDEDDITAVLIVPPGTSTPDRTLVINLRDQCAEGSFDVVKEIVPADPAERAGARQRWRDYQQRGLDVGKFDI